MRSIAPSLPRNHDNLNELLLAEREELPRRLVQVTTLAFGNPDLIAVGTVTGIAAQPSTLIRLAQTLGHADLSDLHEVSRAQLKSRSPDYRGRLARLVAGDNAGCESASEFPNGFAESAIASIESVRRATRSPVRTVSSLRPLSAANEAPRRLRRRFHHPRGLSFKRSAGGGAHDLRASVCAE